MGHQVLFQCSTAAVQLTVNQLVVGSIPATGASFRIVAANLKLNFWLSSDKSYPVIFGCVGKLVTPGDCKSSARKALLVRLKSHPPFLVGSKRDYYSLLSFIESGAANR